MARWRMVGRPCGQFQGDSRVDRFCRTFPIMLLLRCLPIMMDDRHARIANMERTLVIATILVTIHTYPDTETDIHTCTPEGHAYTKR